ncbi:MAG: hypothetical protein U0232_12585 [Thermomicrobiales bacterium]
MPRRRATIEALALAEALGDQPGRRRRSPACSAPRCSMARSPGPELSEQGLAAFRALGETHGLAEALLGVAWQSKSRRGVRPAEALGTEALALFRALGDTGKTSEALWAPRRRGLLPGQHERAAGFHEEGLALARRARGDERVPSSRCRPRPRARFSEATTDARGRSSRRRWRSSRATMIAGAGPCR